MREEIITSLICSACVGLATFAGTVLINGEKIENLNKTITEIKQDIKQLEQKHEEQTNNIWELRLEIAQASNSISTESAGKLRSLISEERYLLDSAFQSNNNFQSNSDISGATSEELLSNDSLSPDLKSLIREHQLTGDDLKSYSSLLEAEIE